MAAQPATQTPTPLRTQVTIEEAARRLGVSSATVRRRAKRGELRATKRELPTGYQWFVDLPVTQGTNEEPAATQAATQDRDAEIRRLEEHVTDLRRRTDDQAREISELHRLLANQQQLLLAAPHVGTPAATQMDMQVSTQEEGVQPGTPAATQMPTQPASTTQPAWPQRRRWWQRLVWG